MSSKHAHSEKALRNEAALSRFDFEPDLYEWYITVSFYAAVHWLRAYFAHSGRYTGENDGTTYNDFPRVVSDIYRAKHGPAFRPAAEMLEAFEQLKDLSQRARYMCRTPGQYARQTGDADRTLKIVRDFVQSEGIDTTA